MKTLYISYFGLNQPLVQTQVLPYLFELSKENDIQLLTFEPETWDETAERQKLKDKGIEWHSLPYRKGNKNTALDILAGAKFARTADVDTLHCRGHIPAIMAALVKGKRNLLFDIRGFLPEEYVDAGIWAKDSLVFKIFKYVEKWVMNRASAYVVLTETAKDEIFPGAKFGYWNGKPVEVIPCCVDFDRFEGAEKIDIKTDKTVVAYVGSLSKAYMPERIADFMSVGVYPMILTQSDPAEMEGLLEERGVTEYLIKKVAPSEIQNYLAAADVALNVKMASYANISCSPTKIPEYLAAGLPVISNSNIGDVDRILTENKVGVILKDFSAESYRDALKEAKNLTGNPKQVAKDNFDLSIGGARYRDIYRKLFSREEREEIREMLEA